jgi:Ribbon-helix-helix protein, copG family
LDRNTSLGDESKQLIGIQHAEVGFYDHTEVAHRSPYWIPLAMPRREVLVQLDDELVEQLDRIAKALGTSRSELLRRGAQAVIVPDAERANDIELIAAYKRQPPDEALIRSALRLGAKTAPTW